jgi:hypothetical protein
VPINLHPQLGLQTRTSAVSQGQLGQFRGAYADRRTRHDLRSAQRWGDWSILGAPQALLWMDSEILAEEVADETLPQPWDDLWP